GLPLQNCNFRGEIYANAPSAWYGTQVNPDCTYEVSVLAGTYNIGYHFDESAGFLNRPIQNSQVTINPGTRLQYDIPVLAGDVRVSVLLLTPSGEPARRNWINADNHIEIDEQRRAAEDQSQNKENAFQGPGGTTSPEELFKFCSKPENEKECSEFKLPGGSEGPGGCKDALACTRYCTEHKKECSKEIDRDPTKKQSGKVVSQSVQIRKSRIASLKPAKVKMFAADQDSDDPFANMINSGSETNDKGVATLTLLSGHCYTFNAGVPPDSSYMPPRSQDLCLSDTTPASLTLTLRTSDGKMSGFVRWNKTAVQNGWIGCWSEDGNSNGTPIMNGTYSLNYAFDTTYHCEANAFDGTKFLRSGQEIVAISREKTKRQDFKLDLSTFEIPPPVSECFDATQPHVITLTDGTTVSIPSNTIATTGTVCVTANPTASVQSSSTARPIGLAYSFEAKDENNKVISTFNNEVTVTFNYNQEQLDEAGVKEESLIPSYWDASSGTWKKPSNLTQKNIADSPDVGTGIITARSSHFTAYAVVSSGGKAGSNMKTVTTSRAKNGVTTIKVGSGKSLVRFKPFASYTGEVDVQTVEVGGKTKQIIIATQAGSSADATTVKVFSVKGKLLRPSLKPWGGAYRKGAQLITDELTGDGLRDLIIVPKLGTTVKVQDLKSWKVYPVQAAARPSEIIAQTFNLLNRGGQQLVTKAGNALLTWKFSGKKFVTFIFDSRKLRVQGNNIERVYLRPTVSSVSATVLKAGKGLKTLTVKGTNLGSGSRVLLNGTIPALRIVAKGETELSVTINLAKLKPKKTYDLKVINADGQQITLSKKLRTK
ncbi:MAG: hypothetical protein HY566_01120, partial [Candidatus Kerfeldbacteria bacterium]|nr:hypothetical protein [Candidatus Kerfeldbacteria bacterium]